MEKSVAAEDNYCRAEKGKRLTFVELGHSGEIVPLRGIQLFDLPGGVSETEEKMTLTIYIPGDSDVQRCSRVFGYAPKHEDGPTFVRNANGRLVVRRTHHAWPPSITGCQIDLLPVWLPSRPCSSPPTLRHEFQSSRG